MSSPENLRSQIDACLRVAARYGDPYRVSMHRLSEEFEAQAKALEETCSSAASPMDLGESMA